MSQSLIHKAGKSVIWSALEGFSVQFIQFIMSIIIARIVSPEEFGLIAMLTIFLAVAQVFIDSGFSNALIQKQDRKEIDYATAFYFNIGFSIFIYFILFHSAKLIAQFYNQPILEIILKCIGLNLIISSASIVQRTKLVIKGDFKTIAKSSLMAAVFSGGIGFYYAYMGLGVWALVIQAMSNQLFITIFLWVYTKWFPRIAFSSKSFMTLFSFGYKILFSGLINVIYVNMYTLIIGKTNSSSGVGYYSRANMFAQFPSISLTSFIVRAIYPIQCEYQNDDEKFLSITYKYIKISTFLIFPVMVILCVLSKPLVYTLLTEMWYPSIDLLMILCIAYMWRPVMGINEVLNAKGRSDLFLRAEMVKKIIAVFLLFISFPLGIKYMCYGLIIYSIFDMIVVIYYVKKIIYIKYLQILKDISPTFFLSLAVGGVVYLSNFLITAPLFQLLSGLILGLSSYLILCYLFKVQELTIVLLMLKNFFFNNTK